jgi:hypothetical protein
VPFYIAGGLKIVYDLLVFRTFRTVKPPEEHLTSIRWRSGPARLR